MNDGKSKTQALCDYVGETEELVSFIFMSFHENKNTSIFILCFLPNIDYYQLIVKMKSIGGVTWTIKGYLLIARFVIRYTS